MMASKKMFEERINKIDHGRGGARLSFFKEGIDAKLLGEFLETNEDVTELSITDNQFGDDGMREIAKGLKAKSSPKMKNLYLSLSALRDKGIQALADAVEIKPTLEVLTLLRNKLGTEGATAVAKIISTKVLRKLFLSQNELGDAGAQPILRAAAETRALERLELSNNGITDDSCFAITDIIEYNSTLQSIDLSMNKLGIHTLRRIVSALERNKNLLELNLGGNAIDPFWHMRTVYKVAEGAEIARLAIKISELLERNRKIAEEKAFIATCQQISNNQAPAYLDLSKDRMSPDLAFNLELLKDSISLEQAELLGILLESNTSITSLSISSEACGDDGIIKIANALKTNKTLTKLEIRNTKEGDVAIGELGLQAIAEALKQNSTLTSFHYSPCKKNHDNTELEKDISRSLLSNIHKSMYPDAQPWPSKQEVSSKPFIITPAAAKSPNEAVVTKRSTNKPKT